MSKKGRARSTFRLAGFGTRNSYRAYNVSVDASERAFKERMYFYKDENGLWAETPRAIPGIVKSESAEFVKLVAKHATWTNPIKRSEYPTHFEGAKRLRYQKAVDNLDTMGRIDYKSLTRVKHFLKFETYNLTLKPDPKPRGINPPSDECLVELGRRFKPIEKKIYKALEQVFGYDIIFKSKNQAQRAKLFREFYDAFDDPVSVDEDASAFESSVKSDWLSFTHVIYMLFLKGDREFATWLKNVLLLEGSFYCQDGKISFKMEGRGSGFPDTSLGNCLISAFHFWRFMQHMGITKHRCGIDGDDKTPIMERRDALRCGLKIKEFYFDRGFRITLGKLEDEFEKLLFCGSQPVCVEGEWLMVRKPLIAISKDSVSRKPLDSELNFKRWIKSVGECGMSQFGGVPILQEFYAALDRNAGNVKAFAKDSFMNEAYSHKVKGMNRKYKKVAESTRASFFFAFGISPDEQEVIERHYANVELAFDSNLRNVPERELPF